MWPTQSSSLHCWISPPEQHVCGMSAQQPTLHWCISAFEIDLHCSYCITHTHICTLPQPPALVFLQARTDELRIQKRFLNDMFARVKQEYLERRLRQQQIEQMLGHKGNLAALPSTSVEEAGPSDALALRPADSAALAQPDASPGQGSFSYAFCLHWEVATRCIVTGRFLCVLFSLGGCYAFCRHWEIPVCSVFTGRFLRVLLSLGDSYVFWFHREIPMWSVFIGRFLCVASLGVSCAFCTHWETPPVCSQSWSCLRHCAKPMSALQYAWQEAHVQLINRTLQLTNCSECLAYCFALG